MNKVLPVAVLCIFAANAFAETPPAGERRWKNTAQVSYLGANGNTKSSTVGASNEFKYAWTKAELEVNAGALGAESAGVATAEQYFANEKLSRKLDDRNYVFEKAGWDKNRLAGVANRLDASLGLGRELVKTGRNNLKLELGGGYVNEQRTAAPREEFASGRAYAKYERKLSETAGASQDVEYLHNFEDSDGYRLNAETALTASVSTHISLKTSYALKRVNDPSTTDRGEQPGRDRRGLSQGAARGRRANGLPRAGRDPEEPSPRLLRNDELGMISYEVPLEACPDTYNGRPLSYAALAAQRNYFALCLPVYADPPLLRRLKDGFKAAGKKLDMGKSCLRFKTPEDLPLEVIAGVIKTVPMKKFVAA